MGVTSEFQQLRELLLSQEVSTLEGLQVDLEALQQEIHNPEELARLLQPVVAEVLKRGDPAVSVAILKSITPILDRAVREKVQQDAASMSSALAPSSTAAIALHYANDPQAAAQDLAPLVSAAIKEQIRGERDSMIDALYPVIGSTISKYLSETLSTLIQTVNARIESHLSFSGLVRKIRSKLTGISEAELLLQESIPLRVEAAFLIHKSSGLVIAQAQAPNALPLDSHLMSGMLTAIRSLFNDSMNTPNGARELDQIEYGEFKIVLEVAGFFYLAAVVRGIPNQEFRDRMRAAVATIVQEHGEALANYGGDPAAVPGGAIHAVEQLIGDRQVAVGGHAHRPPYALLAAAFVLLMAIGIPGFLYLNKNANDRNVETRATAALQAADSFAFRNVSVKADREVLQLSGLAANPYLRTKAEEVARRTFADLTIDNQITMNVDLPLYALEERRVNEIVSTVNTLDGVFVDAAYRNGDLVISGIVEDSSLAEKIIRTFEQLPGVRTFDTYVKPGSRELPQRMLFDLNSVVIRPGEANRLQAIVEILHRTPWSKLLIIGHSDRVGEESVNQRISLGRAKTVQTALLRLGIPERRMSVDGDPTPPPGSATAGADSLGRCTRFLLLKANPITPP